LSREFERNEDWVKRDNGQIPTKRAMAAERASAGLGTSDDDLLIPVREVSSPISQWQKTARKKPPPAKQ
jgi:hypothetical protein